MKEVIYKRDELLKLLKGEDCFLKRGVEKLLKIKKISEEQINFAYVQDMKIYLSWKQNSKFEPGYVWVTKKELDKFYEKGE